MSSSISDPSNTLATSGEHGSSPANKGKSKALNKDVSMEVDDDDDNDDEEEDEEEEKSDEGEESEAEDGYEEIDPTAIVGRRTRGVRVDYTSKEAIEKAGLQEGGEDEDKEEDVDMKA